MEDWANQLLTQTHEKFATLATLQSDGDCPPCMDVSGKALLLPSQIHQYVYGEWQGSLEVQDCLEGIFNILHINPMIMRECGRVPGSCVNAAQVTACSFVV